MTGKAKADARQIDGETNDDVRQQIERITGVKIEPLALAIDDAATAAGVPRTRIYDAVKGNELTARKAGRNTIVEVPELWRWIRSLPTRGRQPEAAA